MGSRGTEPGGRGRKGAWAEGQPVPRAGVWDEEDGADGRAARLEGPRAAAVAHGEGLSVPLFMPGRSAKGSEAERRAGGRRRGLSWAGGEEGRPTVA